MNKILRLVLAITLAPLAFGGAAYAAGPSATLSVNVVPIAGGGGGGGGDGSCGAIMGQAATDAAAAGFNTCALYNDFTTPIPNTVGTGLPVNWLDCAGDGDLSSIWHAGFQYPTLFIPVPCAGHIDVVNDPTYGNLAARLTLSDADVATYGPGDVGVIMQTQNMAQTNPATGANSGNFPTGYFEWTWRCDAQVNIDCQLYQWVGGANQNLSNTPGYNLEIDIDETLCPGDCMSSAGILWTPGGVNSWTGNNVSGGTGTPWTVYHTWGMLYTNDGNMNFSLCTYLDGVQQGCLLQPYSVAGEYLARHFLIWMNMYWSSRGGGTIGTVHEYVKNIRVLSCPNWTSSAPAGMCSGTRLNSSNFYTP